MTVLWGTVSTVWGILIRHCSQQESILNCRNMTWDCYQGGVASIAIMPEQSRVSVILFHPYQGFI